MTWLLDSLHRSQRRLEQLALGGLSLMAFLLPWEELLRVTGWMTITKIVGVIAAGCWVLSLVGRSHRLRRDHVLPWMLAYLGWAGLTLLWAQNKMPGLVILTTMVQLVVFFVMVRSLVRTERTTWLLMAAYILGAALASILAVRYMIYFQAPRASVGAGQYVNQFAKHMGLAVILGCHGLEQRFGQPVKWALAALLTPILVAFALTQSRGAWVALVLSLGVAALLGRWWRATWTVGLVVLILVLQSTGIVAQTAAGLYQVAQAGLSPTESRQTAQSGDDGAGESPAPPETAEIVANPLPRSGDGDAGESPAPPETPDIVANPLPHSGDGDAGESPAPPETPEDVANRLMPLAQKRRAKIFTSDRMGGRIDIWLVGWELVKDNALLGVGLNNFPVRFGDYIDRAKGLTQHMRPGWDPHNTFMSVAGELGVIGLLLFLGFLAVQTRQVWPWGKTTSVTGLVVVAYVVLNGMVDTDQYRKYFWYALALAPLLLRPSPSFAKESTSDGTTDSYPLPHVSHPS